MSIRNLHAYPNVRKFMRIWLEIMYLSNFLEPHHRKILDYITVHGSITQREYGKISKRSLAAAHKLDFEKLLSTDRIERKGIGRGTYYVRKGV